VTEAERTVAFRPDIEGLRAVAVLLVVACHCGITAVAGGFIGVDVFFVLSGYLITKLLVAEIGKRGHIDLPRFYARRVRRLLPASALTLIVTLAAAAIILAPQELVFAARAARAAALYASNIFFDFDAADYFAPGVELNPLLHTWSLGVEEQFYLFWPALVLLGLGKGGSRGRLLAILGTLTLASFGLCVWMTLRQPTFAFYELPARAWEFGVGGLLALAALRAAPWTIIGWAGLLCVLACGWLVPAGPGFPGWRAGLPVAGTLAALAAGAQLPGRGATRLLNLPPLQYLGSRSYSWYLWHWPFVFFAAALVPGIGVGGKVVAAILALGAAELTFRALERPVRASGYLRPRPWLSLALATAITLCTVGITFLGIHAGNAQAGAPQFAAVNAAVDDIAAINRASCVTAYGADSHVTRCEFGPADAKVTVALFGDSHAIQWFNALQGLASANQWRLVTFLKSGCAAHDAAPLLGGSGCRPWRNQALREIVALHPDAVFVASYTSAYGLGQAHPESDLERLRAGWRRSLEVLSAAHLTVIQFRDTPLPPFDVPTCLARALSHAWMRGRSCDLSESAALEPRTFQAEQAAAQGLPGVHFLDLTDRLCRDGICPAVSQGMIVYRDASHVSGTFAASLAGDIASRSQSWIVPAAQTRPALREPPAH
jgi:peptidoglycan/LPS O-acetylase OafA/YrhL